MESNPPQRVWVITGTNAGLGLALASYVLSKGDRVGLMPPSGLDFC